MRSVAGQRRAQLRGDGVLGDQHRLVGAQHRVVESLAVDDASGGGLDVGARIHEDRNVARPDTQSRVARRIGGPDHAGAPGRDDDIGAFIGHQRLDQRNRRLGHHRHDAVGRAGGDCGLGQQLCRIDRALPGPRMRRDDHGVAGHQRQDHLEVHRRNGIRRRCQSQHHSGRTGDLDDLLLDVDAGRDEVLAPVEVEDAARAGPVLDHLVGDHTHLGLGHRGGGEALRFGVPGFDHRVDDRADGALVVLGVGGGGPAGTFQQVAGLVDGGHTFLRPVAAACARPTATSSRSRTSSQRSRPNNKPGLNCRTRGSSVEKMAHTPSS